MKSTYIATLHITSVTGVTLTVIHLPPGTWAAYPDAVNKAAQVEFYDTRYDHTLFGQFTGGRYYAKTLLAAGRDDRGLALNGTEQDWTISAAEFARVRAWLKEME